MSKMKVLSKLAAKPGIWLSEAQMPTIGPNDILVKIKKTAICGTDLHIYNWDEWAQATIPVPMHVGHEYVGTIIEKGELVFGLAVGDRVSGEGHITCGHCRNCRGGREHLCPNTKGIGVNIPGAFAEYLALPARNAFKIPDNISDNLASIFDPFGNAVHTALSFDLIGEDVLITGAGPIGIMAVAICRFAGARHIVITDINEYRLKLAEQMGASLALNVKDCTGQEQTIHKLQQAMRHLGLTEGFDVGLEMSGNVNAISSMIEVMNNGGDIGALGIAGKPININWDKIIWRGLNLKGIYGREMFETWYKMASLLQSGLDINPVITHEFQLAEYQQAFELMASGQCGKVILNWD